MHRREKQSSSQAAQNYFEKIKERNRLSNSIPKTDYWLLFPFATQVEILEYLIINYPEQIICRAMPFSEDKTGIAIKRALLNGLVEIPDMCEAANEVKKRLSIAFELLHITALDSFSEQCYGMRSVYLKKDSWKEEFFDECFDIAESARRTRYFRVKHERHVLLHHMRKIFIVNRKKLYKLDRNKNSITQCKESVIDCKNFCCPSRASRSTHSCIFKRSKGIKNYNDLLVQSFWIRKAHQLFCNVENKLQ